MKKIIFILGLAAVVLGTSCSDVLDLNPADRFSPATVWSTTTTADKYVIGLYSIFGANTEMRGGDAYASPFFFTYLYLWVQIGSLSPLQARPCLFPPASLFCRR